MVWHSLMGPPLMMCSLMCEFFVYESPAGHRRRALLYQQKELHVHGPCCSLSLTKFSLFFLSRILLFHENGFFDTWKHRYWNARSVCSNAMSVANPVTATDMQGPIYVFFAAVCVSCVGLIAELLYHRHKVRKTVRPTRLCSKQLSLDGDSEKKVTASLQSGLNRPIDIEYMKRSDTARTTLSSDCDVDSVCAPVDTT